MTFTSSNEYKNVFKSHFTVKTLFEVYLRWCSALRSAQEQAKSRGYEGPASSGLGVDCK